MDDDVGSIIRQALRGGAAAGAGGVEAEVRRHAGDATGGGAGAGGSRGACLGRGIRRAGTIHGRGY